MNEAAKKVKKLYRSRQDRYLGGVAGGLAEYFSVDSTVFRILFIIFTFTGGIGLILYLISLLIVPDNPHQEEAPKKRLEKDSTFLIAVILILAGVFLLTREFGVFDYFRFWRIPWANIWAVFLILIGVFLIFATRRITLFREGEAPASNILIQVSQIRRSRENRMLAGVCAGIAGHFNIDPSIVRLLWVFAAFASVGLGVLVYVILIFVFPEEGGSGAE